MWTSQISMLVSFHPLLFLALVSAQAVVGSSPSSSSSSGGAATGTTVFTSSGATSATLNQVAFSSTSSYSGNEPAYPGCYLCPAISQCPPFPNTTTYPAFSILATTSTSADAASCNAITSDILVEVNQYATSNSCVAAIGYLACYGSLYQQLDCYHPISPDWPALCENYTSCLEPAGQSFIAEAQLCTNITAFLNRPTSIVTSTSSSSTGITNASGSGSGGGGGSLSSSLMISSSTGPEPSAAFSAPACYYSWLLAALVGASLL